MMIASGDDFRSFIATQLGCEPPARLEPGRFVRFPTNGKHRDDAGYAKLFADGDGGIVGDFRTGESWCWQGKRERQFTDAEKRAWRERIERERRESEVLRAREEQDAERLPRSPRRRRAKPSTPGELVGDVMLLASAHREVRRILLRWQKCGHLRTVLLVNAGMDESDELDEARRAYWREAQRRSRATRRTTIR